MSDDLPNVTDDANQQFVSIYVPNTQDADKPHYHYLRIGVADATTEGGLPADPNDPKGDTNLKQKATISDGISLYTTDSYTLTAPSVNTWSSDSLSAVTDGKDTLYTATYTTGAANGMRPATVTFQNVDQMANTAAASVNFLNGDALTYWNGNDQSLGLGGLLWANYGFTTNLFGGSIMNLTNNSAEIQGFGSFKVSDTNTISATENILLSVSPVASYAGSVVVINAFVGVMAAITAVTTAMNLAMTIELKTASHDEASLKSAMQTLYKEQIVATGLVTLVQALSVVLAAVLKIQEATAAAALASIEMNALGITLRNGTSFISIDPDSIMMSGGGSSLVLANTGMATMSPTSILLSVGPSSVYLTDAGAMVDGPTVNVLPG